MILNRFPTRIGTPHQRWVDSKPEALQRINSNNGVTDVYAALYPQDVIGKVVFDFDIDKYDDWESMMADYRRLTRAIEGYRQMSVFSGTGLHKYLRTTDAELSRPKQAIETVQRMYQDDLDLNSDDAVFGDVKRIFRVPNTYHPDAGRYCIPLTHDEVFNCTQEEIHERASSQRFDVDPVTDGKAFPIHKYDKAGNSMVPEFTGDQIEGSFNPAEVEPEGVLFPIYPCIANILKNWEEMEQKGHGMGFRRRFLVILHLKETGHSYEETVAILKKYMSSREFHHCVYDEKQVRQVYKRDDLLFPDCERLETEIPCIHKQAEPCEDRNTLYY